MTRHFSADPSPDVEAPRSRYGPIDSYTVYSCTAVYFFSFFFGAGFCLYTKTSEISYVNRYLVPDVPSQR